MRYEQLEYLLSAIRLGSMRAAAGELHMSQAALSETIANLERELGVRLLVRSKSGVALSDEGRELYPHITDLLETHDRLNKLAKQQRRMSRVVRIGTTNTATVSVVAPAMKSFHRENRETQVVLLPAQQGDIYRSLLEGRLDVGLVNILDGEAPSPELDTTRLIRGEVVVCLRADHPLAAKTAISADDLASEPLVGSRLGYAMHRFVQRLFDQSPPDYAFTTDGAELVKLLVAEGLGIAVLPDFSVFRDPLERSGLITARPLAAPVTMVDLFLVRRRTTLHSGSTWALTRSLVAAAGEFNDELQATREAPVPAP